MAEQEDFPYMAEYAKSSRASCRGCKGNIEKGSLRLAVLVQSPSFDGKIPYWYHSRCFFTKQRPKCPEDIAHFDSLRWDDQQMIKEKIEKPGAAPEAVSKKGKGSRAASKGGNKDFSVEYSKSSRATCKGCQEKIEKGVVRISKLDYEGETAKRYGPTPMWHHVDCFIDLRKDLEYFDGAAELPGFNTLGADDKKMLKEKIKKIDGKRKAEDQPDTAPKKQKIEKDDLQQSQNKKIFYYRDLLEKNLKVVELKALLEHNDYFDFSGESKCLDVLSDLMTFGVPENCSLCNNGNLYYKFGLGYVCTGNLSEWTKCSNVVEAPKRKPFLVPGEFKEEFGFLKKYKYKKNGDRVVIKREVSKTDSKESKNSSLNGYSFVIAGTNFAKSKEEIKKAVSSFGGEVTSKITPKTAAVITTKDLINKNNKIIKTAKELEVECVTEDFLDELEPDGVILMIKKKNIAPWGNVEERLKQFIKLKSSYKSKSKSSSYELDVPDTMKITLKDGNFIEPSTGLADTCHVYTQSGKTYNVVLGLVDLVKGMNSYYKMQVLESDDKRAWYVYRKWGRIGTKIGDDKLEPTEDLQDALSIFKDVYEKKTGNKFSAKNQKKVPGYWFVMDLDDGKESKKLKKLDLKTSKSKLPQPVQELIALLFDVTSMESTMVEYELDLKKMPLGKLSKKQMEKAYKVLSEALEWIEKIDSKKAADTASVKHHLLDCSNRFYTLIPHDFGMKNPPLLNNVDLIKSKIEMIDSLREIEIAYNLLNAENEPGTSSDPIDSCYRKLKTDVHVLEKSSKEFEMIKKYVTNTHAATHSNYTLDVEEVFTIDREGEKKRFKPFKKLHNHQLLWHGSRLTNFVGIFSQGLRIAPPEAPATGYMFGKGVYFADMVSKSANYCFTSKLSPTGLLLLCDVALGDMYELTRSEYVTKLPAGKHSTKGLGQTYPDPKQTFKLDDGVEVPLGQGISSNVNSVLLYNEFIVYDVGQINVRYLLKTKFNYKY